MTDLPMPLLPSDVDLQDFGFMPLQVERLRRSKQWLIAKHRPEIGFFSINLWMAAWHEVPCGPAHIRSPQHGQIEEMLNADPAQSDRNIARACICSPITVGKIRNKLGLAQALRSVQRRGQMYKMRV